MPASGPFPDYCAPYRVEWRSDLTTSWLLLNSYPHREDADARQLRALEQYGGQSRIVTQHVISVKGLGEDA